MSDATMDPQASPPESGTFDGGGGRAGLVSTLARLAERFANPVLVKEIRQAQRGKVFGIALIATLVLALIASSVVAIGVDATAMERPGPSFFSGVYFFLTAAILVVVPFQAFVSMGSEWDDNTFEMLVLSNLSPKQIVLGKMLAAVVQAALLLACFAPFMAVAFLLRGVDVAMLLLILALTFYASAWFTSVTTMLSTIVRKRFLRVLVMVIVAGGLMMTLPPASMIARSFIEQPDLIADPEFLIGMVQTVVASAIVGAVAVCIACNMLAHEEENRSTNLRVMISVAAVLTLAALTYNVVTPRLYFNRDMIYAVVIAMIFGTGFLASFFVYEPERLGRRVVPTVPRSTALATLTAPWYPGGGRGMLFLLVHLAALAAGAIVVSVVLEVAGQFPAGRRFGSSGILTDGGASMAAGILYVLLYVVLTCGIIHRFGTTAARRNLLRAITIATPMLYLFLPALAGLFVGDRDLTQGRHIGNPGILMDRAWERGLYNYEHFVVLLVIAAGIGVGLNAPRMIAGLSEMRRESRERAQASRDASVTVPVAAAPVPVEVTSDEDLAARG